MAYAIGDNEELTKKFEKWLQTKLAASDDSALICDYILNTLTEDENTDEEKSETIRPLLQELNQSSSIDSDELVSEIISSWNKLKLEDQNSVSNNSTESKSHQSNLPDPTDTILSMINKHKNQLVSDVKRKSEIKSEDNQEPGQIYSGYAEEESDEETNADDGLFANTNSQEAAAKDRQNREKLAEAAAKNKEQIKKAQVEQKQKEVEKKKKAQAKVAKVERKR